MAKLTAPEIIQVLIKGGFAPSAWPVMFGIIMGESGGDTAATAHTTKEYSVGIFQINLYAHPNVSEACAREPVCAAKQAYIISSKGTNFTPWTIFKNDSWKNWLKYYPGPFPADFLSLFPWAKDVTPGPKAGGEGPADPSLPQPQPGPAPSPAPPGSTGGGFIETPDPASALGLPTKDELFAAAKTIVLLSLGLGLVLLGANGLAGENQVAQAAKASIGKVAKGAATVAVGAATGGASTAAKVAAGAATVAKGK